MAKYYKPNGVPIDDETVQEFEDMMSGYICSMYLLRRMDEQAIVERKKAIKERYHNPRIVPRRLMPVNRQFIIRITDQPHHTCHVENMLRWMKMVLEKDDIYMYDPTGTGTGYKYYRGERIIVYQIGAYLSLNERSHVVKQLLKDSANGYSFEKPNPVYKMVIMEVDIPQIPDWPVFDSGDDRSKVRTAFLMAWNGRLFGTKR